MCFPHPHSPTAGVFVDVLDILSVCQSILSVSCKMGDHFSILHAQSVLSVFFFIAACGPEFAFWVGSRDAKFPPLVPRELRKNSR